MYANIYKDGKIAKYLEQASLRKIEKGKGIRTLIRLRCGNMEEGNKYWLNKEVRRCVFCKETEDDL